MYCFRKTFDVLFVLRSIKVVPLNFHQIAFLHRIWREASDTSIIFTIIVYFFKMHTRKSTARVESYEEKENTDGNLNEL